MAARARLVASFDAMLSHLAVANYRSLRDLVLPLEQLNVVTGPNGSGKSNLYRALRLLADVALGRIIPSLAREGGLDSTVWAGPETISRAMRRGEHPVQGTPRKKPVALRLGFAGPDFGYAIDLGLPPPPPPPTAFTHDPQIKGEWVWYGAQLRPSSLSLERKGPLVRSRDDAGEWTVVTKALATFESMMTHAIDPLRTPEALLLREEMRGWRFYDQLRTDREAPARRPQVGTHTPVLSNDGSDLAAALQTILEIGDERALADSVADAFPGSRISIHQEGTQFEVELEQHGLLRPLRAGELSDGTLRYLLWIAALLTPRPPSLLVLNEPETSLHPDLLPALARLIARAAEHAQVIVVSHAIDLVAALARERGCQSIALEKSLGETRVAGAGGPLDRPAWHWPSR